MRANDRIYPVLIDLIPDSIVVVQDDCFQLVNRTFVELFGYTEEDVGRGLSIFKLVQDQDREAARRRLEERLSGNDISRTSRINLITKGGTLVSCEISATVIEYRRRQAVLVVIRDIIERTHIEKTLQKSEVTYKRLVENMLEGVYQAQPDGTIIKANLALVKMLGYESEEELCSGVRAEDLYVRPDDRLTFIRRLKEDGELRTLELHLRRRNGEQIIVLESARVVRDEKGRVLYYEGLLTDITDRRRAELDLRQSEERYRLLIESAGNPITFWDVQGNLLMINSTGAANLGGLPEDFTGKSMQEILPDTADLFLKRNREVVEQRMALEFEDMLELPTGRKWFWSNIQGVEDTSGRVYGVQIISHDITERKQVEERLHATHAQLQATLDALPDMLFEIDCGGRIYDFRAPRPELLYCPPEEFLSMTVDQVLPKDASDVIMASVQELARTGQCPPGATYSLEMQGEEHWFELSVATKSDLRSPEGRVIALVRDVTDRKRNEEKLRMATEDLKAERQRLAEKNIALRQILEHIEGQKQSFRQQVYRDIEQTVKPLVRRLKRKIEPDHAGEFEDFEASIGAVLSKDIRRHMQQYGRLTSRESEICDLITGGMSSKQIAESLNLSLFTVLKHREHIREKFGITGRRVSLSTYMRAQQFQHPQTD